MDKGSNFKSPVLILFQPLTHFRSRSQTPSKVTFLQSREKNIEKQEEQSVNLTIVTKDQKTTDSEESFEWVDFKTKGTPNKFLE